MDHELATELVDGWRGTSSSKRVGWDDGANHASFFEMERSKDIALQVPGVGDRLQSLHLVPGSLLGVGAVAVGAWLFGHVFLG